MLNKEDASSGEKGMEQHRHNHYLKINVNFSVLFHVRDYSVSLSVLFATVTQ